MAGTLINTYAVGDVNLDNMMTTLDDTRRGYHQVSLTEMTTTTVPKIAAGSLIEVAGALYSFASDETLGGSPSDGTVYIYIVPAGATCTAVMTNTAPTWSDAKQGWYGTGGAATYRYLQGVIIVKSATVYTKYVTISSGVRSGGIIHIQNQQNNGTNGGTFTAGSWATRVLNTVVFSNMEGASLSSNTIILPAGTYEAHASATTFNVYASVLRLYNDTTGAAVLRGIPGSQLGTASAYTIGALSIVKGYFTLTATSVIKLQHYCSSSNATYGLGSACAPDGDKEIFSEVIIKKIA